MTNPEHGRGGDALQWALRYAALGLRVIPIKPGHKSPAPLAWVEAASCDPDVITAWWTGLYANHGIGLVLGQVRPDRWLFAVDIDQHGADGGLAWLDLCIAHGDAPDTVTALTGGGGVHLLYWSPFEIRNSRLADGIDIRGAGGQILVEPTIHPNGQPYSWEDGASPFEHKFTRAPEWLLELLTRPEPEPAPRPLADANGDRPGDLWAAQTTWAQLLEADGWTLSHSRDGEDYWVRPGKTKREGISATVGYKGADVLKVFTSSVPLLQPDETYNKFRYLAATRYDGDYAATARALAQQGYHAPDIDWDAFVDGQTASSPDPDVVGDWEPVDLAPHFQGTIKPPRPTILIPTGTEHGLIYPGRVSSLFGESGSGKTWVALAAIASVIRAGGNAILIDLEDSAAGTVARLIALGLTAEDVLPHFSYIGPETAWRPDAAAVFDTVIERTQPELVVIDSTGEAMAAGGIKGNDDDDVARWFAVFPKAIARQGPAVLILDHIPKDPNAPTAYALGSQRKRAAINGASYRVDAIKSPSRDQDGLLKIVTAKDRHGWHTQGRTASMVKITRLDDLVVIDLNVEDGPTGEGPWAPTLLMERLSRWIEVHPDQSKRTILAEVSGKDSYLKAGLDALLAGGFVTETTASRGSTYTVSTPYREDDEALKDVAAPTAAHRGPPRPEPAGPRSPTTAAPAPPPSGQGRGRTAPRTPPKNEPRPEPRPEPSQPKFPTGVETEF